MRGFDEFVETFIGVSGMTKGSSDKRVNKRGLTKEEHLVMNEAFKQGIIYAESGEKGKTEETHKKLRKACIKAKFG